MGKLNPDVERWYGRSKRKSMSSEDNISAKKNGKSKRRRTVARNKTVVLEKDVFISKIHARPINEKYALVEKIGQGGFGAVYVAKDISNGGEVALKLEHKPVEPSKLGTEAEMYHVFQGCTGFPDVYWCGWHDDYQVMAFELLGPSLEDLFVFCERRFSLKTVLMVMDQLLQRLEALHTRKLLHRDIKPQNCLLGSGAKGNLVYMIDFGLAQYMDTSDDTKDSASARPHLDGTARYASIRAHEGRPQSARDDLESLGYMMVYFLQGHLPWQGLKAGSRDKATLVWEKKKSITVKELCKGLPAEFAEYMSNVSSLHCHETPKYAEMRQSFRKLARKKRVNYDDIFDWTIRWYLQQAGVG